MPPLNPNKSPTGISSFADVKGLARDRPWLLPSVSHAYLFSILIFLLNGLGTDPSYLVA